METYVLHIVPLIGSESWRNEAMNFLQSLYLRFSLKMMLQGLNLFIKGRQIYLIANLS